MRTYVIAEVGPNHNGSVEGALELVQRIAGTGVDAVKFQIAVPENVYSRDAFKAHYQRANDGEGLAIEMSRRLQLSRDDHRRLYAACRSAGIAYMCTAFDLDSLRFIDQTFDLPYFKIASGEILSIDMLEYIAERNRPVLLSTGMATMDEIAQAIGILERNGPRDITILHCVSRYPAPHRSINLNVLKTIAARFGRPVGYSDHSLGIECCLGAVSLGAQVIEKHVTLDRSLPGPDHKASATVEEFSTLTRAIRRLDEALGTPEKSFTEEELDIRRMARKSIVTARPITVGTTITRDDICFKRPGTGLSPFLLANVLGRRAKRTLEPDRVIDPADLE